MSYRRVIPRDLFNEGNLLKCYGQLYLNLEHLAEGVARLVHAEDGDNQPFLVEQNQDTGGITLLNVVLIVRERLCPLERPLNSRRPYPLYLTTEKNEQIAVFEDDGSFTEEMEAYLNGG